MSRFSLLAMALFAAPFSHSPNPDGQRRRTRGRCFRRRGPRRGHQGHQPGHQPDPHGRQQRSRRLHRSLSHPRAVHLEADGKGFSNYKHSAFTLQVDQEQRLDIRLEVGSTSQTVTVAETPAALNTESGTRGDVTSNAEITEMPLNGRNFTDLAYLTGGVVPKGDGADGQFAVNGARADNVSFLVDGMNNTQRRNTAFMVSPPLEGIQEFKMITSGFSAEYGRFAGGVLSMVTKSGGNRVRGSLYEFLRNDALDARNFFDAGKSKLIQNQFGATVSGPVLLPKLYNGQDRTFFLFSWESLRQISGSTQRGIVPQPQMLQGNFSSAVDAFGKPETIIDPLAKNAPFPGNQIPVGAPRSGGAEHRRLLSRAESRRARPTTTWRKATPPAATTSTASKWTTRSATTTG